MCFEGCLPLMLGDTPHEIAAGEFYMFASNQPHAYRNDGAVVAWFVRNVVI
jgi:quercetin dioxygenase-like cupin family protein